MEFHGFIQLTVGVPIYILGDFLTSNVSVNCNDYIDFICSKLSEADFVSKS